MSSIASFRSSSFGFDFDTIDINCRLLLDFLLYRYDFFLNYVVAIFFAHYQLLHRIYSYRSFSMTHLRTIVRRRNNKNYSLYICEMIYSNPNSLIWMRHSIVRMTNECECAIKFPVRNDDKQARRPLSIRLLLILRHRRRAYHNLVCLMLKTNHQVNDEAVADVTRSHHHHLSHSRV